jgi:hypothetical protein
MHMLQQVLVAQQCLPLLAVVCAGSVSCKASGALSLHSRQQQQQVRPRPLLLLAQQV